jgi:hypothetical protein
VAVSVLLVGGLLVAALTTLGGAAAGRRKIADRGLGELLAQDLMGEILRQPYEEPVDTPVFGLEASESTGNRSAFDDVDDYNGWVDSPPQRKDGTLIPEGTGWLRRVTVVYAASDDLTSTVGTDQGVKRVTVAVERNGVPAASVVAVRTGTPQFTEVIIDRRVLPAEQTE